LAKRQQKSLKEAKVKRRIIALSIGLLGVFLLTACTTSQGKGEEVGKATRPEWKIGDTWVFKSNYYTKPKRRFITESRKVIKEEDFEETPCYVVTDVKHGRKFYYTLNLNEKAIFLKGRLFLKFTPDIRSFDWPLVVGKKWKQPYTAVRMSKKGKKEVEQLVNATFEVTGIEEIETPAGKFTTFKIVEWSPKIKNFAFQEWWYSPELQWVVQQKTHWKFGTEELELKKYKIK